MPDKMFTVFTEAIFNTYTEDNQQKWEEFQKEMISDLKKANEIVTTIEEKKCVQEMGNLNKEYDQKYKELVQLLQAGADTATISEFNI